MTQPTEGTRRASGPVDEAVRQAAQVGQHAGTEGSQLAQTAGDQAKNVTAEAGRQARDLMGEARSQLGEQATTQQRKVANALRSLVDELTSMAERTEKTGPVTELARQAADKARQATEWLEAREPGDLLEEVRRVGRQRPGTFLVGAALAGLLVGRLTRGMVEAASGTTSESGSHRTADPQAMPAQLAPESSPAIARPVDQVPTSVSDASLPPYSAPGTPAGPGQEGPVYR